MPEHSLSEDTIPFYPDHVRTELKVTIGLLILALVVGLIGLIAPVGIGDPADSMNTPAHVKPEWYFLALYQLLKFIPKNIGALIPVILVGLLVLWPFIDRKPDRSRRVARIRFWIVVALTILVIALTIWGEVS